MIVLRAYKTELDLSERVYECEVCGLIIDRDLNAALNLERWPTASSAGRHWTMIILSGIISTLWGNPEHF
jgi:transposase